MKHLEGAEYERDQRQAGFVSRLKAARPELFAGVDVRFVVLYRGWCGGLIPSADFARMKRAAADGLRAVLATYPGRARLDGAYLDLHGAMGAEGSEDAEAELVEAVRAAVPVALCAASFDLHGNVSARLAAALDIVAAYKTFPHLDMEETKTKALRMLLACLGHQSGPGGAANRPEVVIVTIPAILTAETVMTDDVDGLGRELYRWLRDLEPHEWRVPELVGLLGAPNPAVAPVDGLLDASFFVGHGHEDTPRVGAAVLLTGHTAAVPRLRRLAQTIAQWYWDRRAQFRLPVGAGSLLGWDAAVVEVYRCFDAGRPVLVADRGDNGNTGASGDVPFVCRSMLQLSRMVRPTGRPHPRTLICGLTDNAAVEACVHAVVAAEHAGAENRPPQLATVTIGGAAGGEYGDGCHPLELRDAAVLRVLNDGKWAVLQASPSVTVVLQRSTWAFFGQSDVDRLTPEFHPSKYDVVVVKHGTIEQLVVPMGGRIGHSCCIMAATPGANAYPIPARHNLRPGMYPLCSDAVWTAPEGTCPRWAEHGAETAGGDTALTRTMKGPAP